ncbi:carbohydrate ABC transporter permease [Herpetosiphon giganteus]|uniref:carbohydrate ABC transporter permease n=1 Tax=Herpetosiphon giganteus TaxID=2029754 RepID=UPI001958FC99|nr:sugar ABC transporter permease [Herpetosiphon giganteus]MBM7842367.1 multiple sugar transport system permease protein [Herpetosiphon giganteus]
MTILKSPTAPPKATARTPMLGWKRREQRVAWAFVAPALLLLCIFLIAPFGLAFYLSLTDQRLVPNLNIPTRFVGFKHYLAMWQDATFVRALLNNFLFVLIVVPVQTSFALFLAILVNQKIKAINFFRTIYFIPVVTMMAIVAVVWTFLYNPDQGIINSFIQTISFGQLGPYRWLEDPKLAFPAIMLMSIWQGVGFQMVIYLAGLQEIPGELYEAAELDGADAWQQFRFVTLPQLRNTSVFVVISTTIMAFKLFDQVEIMTKGGPNDATVTAMLHIVNSGFRSQKVGYASALSVVFFVIVLLISLGQRIVTRPER